MNSSKMIVVLLIVSLLVLASMIVTKDVLGYWDGIVTAIAVGFVYDGGAWFLARRAARKQRS